MPPEALLDNAWRNRVIPTLFQWAGTQPNPWVLGDLNIRNTLVSIGQAVYGDLDLNLGIAEDAAPGKHAPFTRSHAFQLVCSSR